MSCAVTRVVRLALPALFAFACASSSSTSSRDGAATADAVAGDTAAADTAATDMAASDTAATDTATSDLAAADGATAAGCGATFAKSTANLAGAATALAGGCNIERSSDMMGHTQLDYGLTDMLAGTRLLNVDQFVPDATAGTAFLVEDGSDFNAQRGVYVSYTELMGLDSTKLWVADKVLLEIESISGKTYTLQLTNVHFAAGPNSMGDNKATGDFELSGTITATLP